MALLDAHGVILDRPISGNFHFPVVTGITAGMPLDSREERMQLFSGFTQQVESVRPDAVDRISEVDLSDDHDLRATLTGFEPVVATSATPDSQPPLRVDAPVIVRFSREAVVNQDVVILAQQRPPKLAATRSRRHSR
jgi:hypothetical protein